MAARDSISKLLERGMSQKDIAAAIGVTPSAVNQILRGERTGNFQAKKLTALVRKTPQPIPIETSTDNGRSANNTRGIGRAGAGVTPSTDPPTSTDYTAAYPAELRERLSALRNAGAFGSLGSAIGSYRDDGTDLASGVGSFSQVANGAIGNNALDATHDRGVRQENRDDGRSGGASRDDSGGAGASASEFERDSSGASRSSARKGLAPIPFERIRGGKKEGKDKAQESGAYAYVPWLKDARPLTFDEAENIRENVIFGLEQLEQGMDDIITNTNKQHLEAQIWSTIDREDNEFLAEALLRAAMKDPAVAQAVRAIAESSAWLKAGLITVPRFFETVRFYRQYGVALPI